MKTLLILLLMLPVVGWGQVEILHYLAPKMSEADKWDSLQRAHSLEMRIVRLYDLYAEECANDSVQISYPHPGCLVYGCMIKEWVEVTPTFEGFIEYLRRKK